MGRNNILHILHYQNFPVIHKAYNWSICVKLIQSVGTKFSCFQIIR